MTQVASQFTQNYGEYFNRRASRLTSRSLTSLKLADEERKKRTLQISLFPFLSILACVIGILTLMITAIVIAQIDPESVNDKIETALEG